MGGAEIGTEKIKWMHLRSVARSRDEKIKLVQYKQNTHKPSQPFLFTVHWTSSARLRIVTQDAFFWNRRINANTHTLSHKSVTCKCTACRLKRMNFHHTPSPPSSAQWVEQASLNTFIIEGVLLHKTAQKKSSLCYILVFVHVLLNNGGGAEMATQKKKQTEDGNPWVQPLMMFCL